MNIRTLIPALAVACLALGAPRADAQAPDSLRTYRLGEQLVAAPAPQTVGEPGRTELPWNVLVARDGPALDRIAPLVPSTRVATNSRGEAVLTIRAATLRQVAVFQDGVRLNVPWDERVDASQVPTAVIGAVNVTRGTASVLDGPNTPGGVVHLVSRAPAADGLRQRYWAEGGELGGFRLGWLGLARQGAWSGIAAVERHGRDGFLLPSSFAPERNQSPGSRGRLNSQSDQVAVFGRAARSLTRGGTVAVSINATRGDKGVPPETNTGDARYWRIQDLGRVLASAAADWYVDEERLWRATVLASLDGFRQDIQAFDDSTYTGTDATLEANLEENRDTTRSLRLRLQRNAGRRSPVQLSGTVSWRATTHRERDGRDPGLTFSQDLFGVGIEWDGEAGDYQLRLGAGIDVARTPRTGDKPRRSSDTAEALVARVSRSIGTHAQAHVGYGRRSRFPSLRELYSGALGRFVPNPDLAPEELETLELSTGTQRTGWRVSGALFAQRIRGGIVRRGLGDGQFQRRNEERIRTIGAEIDVGVRLSRAWQVAWNGSLLGTRARAADGEFDAPVERRPELLSHLQVAGEWPAWTARVEATATGALYSLDDDALRKLPSTITWNARGAWRHRPTKSRPWMAEIFVRVDNLADTETLAQVGLPEPGRRVATGARLEF